MDFQRLKEFVDSPSAKVTAFVIGIIGTILGIVSRLITNSQAMFNVALVLLTIGGIVLVTAGLSSSIGIFRTWRKHKMLNSTWDAVYEYLAKHYGWGYDSLNVSLTLNDDGSGVVESKVILRTHMTLEKIQQTLMIDAPLKDGYHTNGDSRIRIHSNTEGLWFTLSKPLLTTIPTGDIHGQLIDIIPSRVLTDGDVVTFTLQEDLPRDTYAINWTQARLDADNPSGIDYFGWQIDRPTKVLKEHVYFPAGFQPIGCAHEVRIVPLLSKDIRLQIKEIERLQRHMQLVEVPGKRYEIDFPVDQPIMSLAYLVRWIPQARRDD
jgi:hypothetical protein